MAVRSVWLLSMLSCVSRCGRLRLSSVGKNCGGVGYRRIPVDVAVAERITEVEYVIEAVIQPECADIDQCLFMVLFGQAIKVRAVDAQGRAIYVGKTVIRDIVFVLEQVAQRNLRRRAEAEGDRRRKTLPF